MNKETLAQISELTQQTVNHYKLLKELYSKKKTSLMSQDIEQLQDIDPVIVQELSKIKELTNTIKTLGSEDGKLSSLIEQAKGIDTELARKFEDYKEELTELAKEINQLEKTNHELLKQGLNITLKMINHIMGSNYTNTEEYDSKGKTKMVSDMSSIEKSI